MSTINVFAQQLVAGAQIEYTAGVALIYESQKLVDIGLFYQRKEFKGGRDVENDFGGAMLLLPIVKTEKACVLRGGKGRCN